jgi:hypothetical protein
MPATRKTPRIGGDHGVESGDTEAGRSHDGQYYRELVLLRATTKSTKERGDATPSRRRRERRRGEGEGARGPEGRRQRSLEEVAAYRRSDPFHPNSILIKLIGSLVYNSNDESNPQLVFSNFYHVYIWLQKL